jgi:DNA repair protein RadC
MPTYPSLTDVRSIDPPAYATRADDDAATIAAALAILDARVRTGPIFNSPQEVKDYARMYFAPHSAAHREVFACLWLDPQHRLISAETMFHGTLSQTSVYPREVIKRALELGAGAVILAHNHPSGSADPSRADEHLTTTLKAALQLVDVRVLDHLVVGNPQVTSFAERGLL